LAVAFFTRLFFFAAFFTEGFFAEVLGLRMVSPVADMMENKHVTPNETAIVSKDTDARCFHGSVL
jgi:hypothetical protein